MAKITKEKILKAFSFKKGGTYLMLYRYDSNVDVTSVQDIVRDLSTRMDINLFCLGVFDLDYVKFTDLEKLYIKPDS